MIVAGQSEPFQLIEEELTKIKCKECKKELSNYFVFGNGFFCTICFSKLKQIECVQLEKLSHILAESTQQYKKAKNSPESALSVNSTQINKKYQTLKAKRDDLLQMDLITSKNKTLQKLEFINEACLDENTNYALEELYEPSLKVSSNMSITDILERNLDSLKLNQSGDQTVCEFIQKDTKEFNQTTARRLKQIKDSLAKLQSESLSVIEKYYKDLQALKK